MRTRSAVTMLIAGAAAGCLACHASTADEPGPRDESADATATDASAPSVEDASASDGPGRAYRRRPLYIGTSGGSNQEGCPVSQDNLNDAGGLDDLKNRFAMTGADHGNSVVYGTQRIVFFGDPSPKSGVSGAWKGGDSVGYFAADASICSQMSMVQQQMLTAGVFSPGVVVAPDSGETINDFVFNPAAPPTGAIALPKAPDGGVIAAVPGGYEVPVGAFTHVGGSQDIYVLYGGSYHCTDKGGDGGGGTLDSGCCRSDGGGGCLNNDHPEPSVSYVTLWAGAQLDASALSPNYPNTYQVVSKIDYNDQPDMVSDGGTCLVASGAPSYGPPSSGWASQPLGGRFIQVDPVQAIDPSDGKAYLYLFGTGLYRQSHVFLARIPETQIANIGSHEYLWQVPEFRIWTGSWQAVDAGAAPSAIDNEACPTVGEISVRYFSNQRLWVMMYAPKGSDQVVVSWSDSPGGPWSAPTALIDLTDAGDLATYCCAADNTCTGEQVINCAYSGGAPTHPLNGGFYAPYMLPDLSNLRQGACEGGLCACNFNVSYLASTFAPYDSVMMNFAMSTMLDSGCD